MGRRIFSIMGLFLLMMLLAQVHGMPSKKDCATTLRTQMQVPRDIQPAQTFEALVNWIHDEIIVNRKAPGLVVGISGTDSILAFLASARAFAKAGRPNRAVGLHFVNSQSADKSENLLSESWFEDQVIPWLKRQAPGAQVIIDSSIDANRDGLRWGALLDWSVIENPVTGQLRLPDQRFWVVGTHNATEEALLSYSNVSNAASVQPLTHLWKSEVLKICKYLGVPQVAINKSCDANCICGRDQLPAAYIPEVDALLMVRKGLLAPSYTEHTIPASLREQLNSYIDFQLNTGRFKREIPYIADNSVIQTSQDYKAQDLSDADPRVLSAAVPDILSKGLANLAADLVATPSSSLPNWLPEALTLFNTPGLRSSQQSQMIEAIFGPSALTLPQVHRLAKISGRLGFYGFSFPQWRYLTQRVSDQPTLAEQFGMIRRLDDGALGAGFIIQNGDVSIEYRRSYILVSKTKDAATLVIRNNSYYYGRDRLAHAIYFSFDSLSAQQRTDLTAELLDSVKPFHPWPEFLSADPQIVFADKLRLAEGLLNSLDEINFKMDRWLRGDGFATFVNFLKFKLNEYEKLDNKKPHLYLGVVHGLAPSWYPKSVLLLNRSLLERLQTPIDLERLLSPPIDGRIVLLNGPQGDFP